MGILKDKFKSKADAAAAEIKDLLKQHGNKVIGEVTLSQIYQGMRGITGLVTETSLLAISTPALAMSIPALAITTLFGATP